MSRESSRDSHDLHETLDNVVDLVAKRLDADVCSVYLTAAEPPAPDAPSATMGLARKRRRQRAPARWARDSSGWSPSSAEADGLCRGVEPPGVSLLPRDRRGAVPLAHGRAAQACPVSSRSVSPSACSSCRPANAAASRTATSACSRPARSLISPVVMNCAADLAVVASTDEQTLAHARGARACGGRGERPRPGRAPRRTATCAPRARRRPAASRSVRCTSSRTNDRPRTRHYEVRRAKTRRRSADRPRREALKRRAPRAPRPSRRRRRPLRRRLRCGLQYATSRSSRTRASFRSSTRASMGRAVPSRRCGA